MLDMMQKLCSNNLRMLTLTYDAYVHATTAFFLLSNSLLLFLQQHLPFFSSSSHQLSLFPQVFGRTSNGCSGERGQGWLGDICDILGCSKKSPAITILSHDLLTLIDWPLLYSFPS
uniref:Uncharacterized protein n=1 Tax=Arundo donax TaxID=35708 RepID=A0A0A9GDC2_ARUDO